MRAPAQKINTTAEFHRDVLLMLANAFQYNNFHHEIYEMAEEVYAHAKESIETLRATEASAPSPPTTLPAELEAAGAKRSRKSDPDLAVPRGQAPKRARRA